MQIPFAVPLVLVLAAVATANEEKQPSIGIGVAELSKAKIAELKLPVRIGVVVIEVEEGKPAAKAGLQSTDILVRINNTPIGNVEALKTWIGTTKEGETYRFEVYRRGSKPAWNRKVIPVKVVYVAKPKEAAVPPAPDLAVWKEWESEQSKLPPEDRPFDIKGDRLGMSLDMFKARHHRMLPDERRSLPMCSDSMPDSENPFLLYKPDLQKAGIVHGRTTFPYEENSTKPNFPTIAGVPSSLFVYKFIDGNLYDMTVFIAHDNYGQVIEALEAKYGKATSKNTKEYQNGFGAKFSGEVLIWSNAVSDITVFERAGQLDTSLLIFSHKKLNQLASDRIKEKIKPRTDDL